jgi:hypothetical protein
MELHIGVVHTPKELSLELEGTPDELVERIDSAMKDGLPIVWVTDAKGRKVGIPADKIAYVEIDAEGGGRHVGFGR